jgi:hypothetical protein
MMPDPGYTTVVKAAIILHVSEDTVRRMLRSGMFIDPRHPDRSYIRTSRRGPYRIPVDEHGVPVVREP